MPISWTMLWAWANRQTPVTTLCFWIWFICFEEWRVHCPGDEICWHVGSQPFMMLHKVMQKSNNVECCFVCQLVSVTLLFQMLNDLDSDDLWQICPLIHVTYTHHSNSQVSFSSWTLWIFCCFAVTACVPSPAKRPRTVPEEDQPLVVQLSPLPPAEVKYSQCRVRSLFAFNLSFDF